MTPDSPPLIQMAGISKTYRGGVVANDDVSLSVLEGTIHAVIGENGAGKSTLMNILYGRIQPDKGRIRLRGMDVKIDSPGQAIGLGIGMVSQHTTMVPTLSLIENIVLGAEPMKGMVIDIPTAMIQVRGIASSLGIALDWMAKSETQSVAALQKAEIVKMMFHGARILVMDEPTATLAPQEAEALFSLLHKLVESGSTVLLVTHKLREVMAHSERITILRGGKLSGERLTAKTYPRDLLSLMLGGKTTIGGQNLTEDPEAQDLAITPWERGPHSELIAETHTGAIDSLRPVVAHLGNSAPILETVGVSVLNDKHVPAVNELSIAIMPGEVLGIAGVDGSGQKELAEAIFGLRRIKSGEIRLGGQEISRLSVAKRISKGIAYVPEDRQTEGLVQEFSIAENMLLGRQRDRNFGGGVVLDLGMATVIGEEAVVSHRIRAGGGDVLAGALSGGNQQKVVIARALDGNPRLLIACQPTRGLDVEATRFVYESFRRGLVEGLAIILFSLDIDELFEMANRIGVLFNGTLAGIRERRSTSHEEIGRMMLEGAA